MSDADVGVDFVRRFASYWEAPDPRRLHELLTEDVTLRAPLGPTTHGLPAARAAFTRLLGTIPDLHAVVDRWSARDDTVFIEFRLRGTIGGRMVEWPAVDRFTLRGDLATERVSYFDALPLLGPVLRSPRVLWRLVRGG